MKIDKNDRLAILLGIFAFGAGGETLDILKSADGDNSNPGFIVAAIITVASAFGAFYFFLKKKVK